MVLGWSIVVTLAVGQAGTDGGVEILRESALRDSQALEHVRELTDTVGPRLSGSPGDRKAVAWGLARMKALGFQNVRAEKVKVPRWERLAESAELTAPGRQPLVISALGGSISTPAKGIEAEVVMAPTVEALAAMPRDQVKGRIVFLNKKMVRDVTGKGYGETVDIRSRGMHAAAELGAAAVVIRSVGTSNARFAHTGMVRVEKGKRQIPAAALAIPDAETIERLLEKGPVRMRLTVKTRTWPDAESANVVGEIPGTGPLSDGIVVLGAHLDSWDVGQGAVDNAAGVGVVLEAGRLWATSPKPSSRTLRVVLFANEENGGKGGDAYAEAHASESARHHAAVVCDSGAGRVRGLAYHAGRDSEPLLRPITADLAMLQVEGAAYRFMAHPDIEGLMKQGVPILSLTQDASRYFDLHHTADDTFDKIDPDEYHQLVASMTVLVHHLLTMDQPLSRIPEAERERTAAGH